MTNPSFNKRYLKIGWTRDINKRLKQASGTNVPDAYELNACYSVINMDKAEKSIFKILNSFRYKENKEFFVVELEYAKYICYLVTNAINTKKMIDFNAIKTNNIEHLLG